MINIECEPEQVVRHAPARCSAAAMNEEVPETQPKYRTFFESPHRRHVCPPTRFYRCRRPKYCA